MSWNSGRRGVGVWVFPATAFAATALLSSLPGSPVGPGLWPARGPFGAFTWVSWFVTSGTALTLVSLAALPAGRRSRSLPAGLAYGLLAASAYASAALSDGIARSPAVSLALALAGWAAVRALVVRIIAPAPGGLS